MTQLGEPVPDTIINIRSIISGLLEKNSYEMIDASSFVGGKDYLSKIWGLLIGVPVGIAIVTNSMTKKTLANIFYELGVMNSHGKDTIVIKTDDFDIPSDFVRTEYIKYNHSFKDNFKKFISSLEDQVEYYNTMAYATEANPALTFDYNRRAYLLSNNPDFYKEIEKLILDKTIDAQTKFNIKSFLRVCK
jgi:hypothetical protein